MWRQIKVQKRNRQHPAHCPSWANCIPMIFNTHPNVANLFVHELEGAQWELWVLQLKPGGQ